MQTLQNFSPYSIEALKLPCRGQIVPDRRCGVVPEVVLVRRGVFGVPGVWKGEGWGEGGSKGVSLQAT
jgi:hypothetical protein